jgi:hypothetical protein
VVIFILCKGLIGKNEKGCRETHSTPSRDVLPDKDTSCESLGGHSLAPSN